MTAWLEGQFSGFPGPPLIEYPGNRIRHQLKEFQRNLSSKLDSPAVSALRSFRATVTEIPPRRSFRLGTSAESGRQPPDRVSEVALTIVGTVIVPHCSPWARVTQARATPRRRGLAATMIHYQHILAAAKLPESKAAYHAGHRPLTFQTWPTVSSCCQQYH